MVQKLPNEWKEIYLNNQDRLKSYEAIKNSPKSGDTKLVETSCPPSFLWSLAEKYGLGDTYLKEVPKLMDQVHGTKSLVADKLPSWMFRRLFEAAPIERRGKLLKDVFYEMLRTSKSQNISPEGLLIQITPMAGEADVDLRTKTLQSPSLYLDAFKKAKSQEDLAGMEQVKLGVVLRREDGLEVNTQVINSYSDDSEVVNFTIGGFRNLGSEDLELVDKVHAKGKSASVVWAQSEASTYAEMGERIKSEWESLKDRLKPGDSLVYPTALIKNYDELEKELWEKVKQGVQLEISVSSSLSAGFSLKEVADFIKNCPPDARSNLKIVSGNAAVWDEITSDMFKLLKDTNVAQEDLPQLLQAQSS